MKIGPNHESMPLNRPSQESAKGTNGKPVETDPVAGAKGNPESDATGQPEDTLHLSGHSETIGARVGYDSQELRDRLVAARNLSKDSPADVEASGETDSTKLNTIRQLVDSGFYETNEVKQQIADKLADEFIDG